MNDDEREDIRKKFKDDVNMSPSAIEKWLDTDESKSVGQKKGGSSESTGHKEGKKIVQILSKKKNDFDNDDYKHMKKVSGYIARHSKQKPDGDVTDTPWRYSLMNWGHDPKK